MAPGVAISNFPRSKHFPSGYVLERVGVACFCVVMRIR
jgi:hypothetical protein